jgi:hypothetical protein
MEDGRVHWAWAVDSHADIIEAAGIKDDFLPPRFAKVEIAPTNGDYLAPDKWVFRLDEDTAPTWWTEKHEKFAWGEFRKWRRKLNRILMRKPIVHPLRDVRPPKKITKRHLALLKEWASVRDSVWDSVGDSVRDSVGDSVGASIRAYVGSFFALPRKAWKYTENIKTTCYPFQPAVDLWNMGIVSSFDGKAWRLHGGKDGKVLWRGRI